MKEIPLTKGQFALVDDEDYEKLSEHKWYARWVPGTRSYYAVRQSSREGGKQKCIRMSRVILDARPGQQGDHRNHDTLDNRRENLRLCTNGENQHNQRPQTGCSSSFKGVYWQKARHKWGAQIGHDGHGYHLGCFADEVAAALAYDTAAREMFGEFAFTNF